MAVERKPDFAYRVFLPGHYVLACKDLGRESLDAAMDRLHVIAELNATKGVTAGGAHAGLHL